MPANDRMLQLFVKVACDQLWMLVGLGAGPDIAGGDVALHQSVQQRWQAVAARMGIDQALVIDRHGRRMATPPMAARLLPMARAEADHTASG